MASIVRGEGEGEVVSWQMGLEDGVIMFLYGIIGESLDLTEALFITQNEGKLQSEMLDLNESLTITNS